MSAPLGCQATARGGWRGKGEEGGREGGQEVKVLFKPCKFSSLGTERVCVSVCVCVFFVFSDLEAEDTGLTGCHPPPPTKQACFPFFPPSPRRAQPECRSVYLPRIHVGRLHFVDCRAADCPPDSVYMSKFACVRRAGPAHQLGWDGMGWEGRGRRCIPAQRDERGAREPHERWMAPCGVASLPRYNLITSNG